jgi:hypothetical protein
VAESFHGGGRSQGTREKKRKTKGKSRGRRFRATLYLLLNDEGGKENIKNLPCEELPKATEPVPIARA